jgi:2-keto-4-pentenoate hydratase/2-oxohepta-3-ene-1,7-dioic acid hydratase in catechol pathway
MRLATIHAEGRDRLGLSAGNRIVDLGAALAVFVGPQAPRSMIELIEGWAEAAPFLADIAARPCDFLSFAEDAVTWRAPVPNASKICCLALNNSANADRIMKGPDHPAMFVKPPSTLAGHGQPIECKPVYGRVHPEPELAVVIGRRAKDVTAADAMDHVFGYTIHNDLTSPTMRADDTFHYRAIHPRADDPGQIEYVDTWVSYPGRYKCSDTFSPMGPWLVTKDAVPDPHALTVACSHQGRLMTEDSTANLSFKTAEVIAYLSEFLTLLPGDIVSMGTALKRSGGGGAVQNIDLNRLGGPIDVAIEGLGVLSNPVAWV